MSQYIDIESLNQQIAIESAFLDKLLESQSKVMVGQKHLMNSLLLGLLTKGHILLEGLPGLAKTLAIKTLASSIDSKFSRICWIGNWNLFCRNRKSCRLCRQQYQ